MSLKVPKLPAFLSGANTAWPTPRPDDCAKIKKIREAEQARAYKAAIASTLDTALPATPATSRRAGRSRMGVLLPDLRAEGDGVLVGRRVLELLAEPFAVEGLLRTVEAPLSTAARTPGRFTRIFPATPASIDRAAREVSAFSLRCSISPTARARVATCCAELVENAVRHAHTDSAGTVEVELTIDGRRVEMVVRDCGKGFDAVALGLDHMIDARDGGLARVSALSEDFQIESSDAGTVARASFDIFRVRFDGEGGLDLSEHDWLAPETTRGLLEVLTGPAREENLELSPALAVTVGRLLAGPDRRRVLQTALWS